jgi:1,4-dihydroxy-6-naphthoate synthase
VLTNGLTDLTGTTVAVPGERTTAYLLFRLWAAQRGLGDSLHNEVMPFPDIMPAVRDGKVDAGLVIHEARFTYPDYGLTSVVDLGGWWESDTGLPIPLGAIVARRTLDAAAITKAIRASVEFAFDDPDASRDYVAEHAQDMDPSVQARHIGLYVNDFTVDLGEDGRDAIRSLLTRAEAAGLVPTLSAKALADLAG